MDSFDYDDISDSLFISRKEPTDKVNGSAEIGNLVIDFTSRGKIVNVEFKGISENEMDLFEFDLFLASLGKDKLDESTRFVRELREKADRGEVDLSGYEDLLDEY